MIRAICTQSTFPCHSLPITILMNNSYNSLLLYHCISPAVGETVILSLLILDKEFAAHNYQLRTEKLVAR